MQHVKKLWAEGADAMAIGRRAAWGVQQIARRYLVSWVGDAWGSFPYEHQDLLTSLPAPLRLLRLLAVL